ncbi:MAG: hypothetical protein IK085_08185 [Clostridia bacterium]|nr:hypothetical protein [Clostridia bacterium]
MIIKNTMNKEKVISNIAVIVLSVVLAAWLPVSGYIIRNYYPDYLYGIHIFTAAAIILSVIVGLIKSKLKWIFCILPAAVILALGMIENDIDSITFSPFLALGSSAIVSIVTLIKYAVKKWLKYD